MAPIGQTNAVADDVAKFQQWAANVMPAALALGLVNSYMYARQNLFGIPVIQLQGPDPTARQPVNVTKFPFTKLAKRLETLGPSLGPKLAILAPLTSSIETQVNAAITTYLGGLSGIDPTGAWAWLLFKNPDGSLLFFPGAGTTFTLPGLVFPYFAPGVTVPTTVSITIDPATGIGTVAYADAQGQVVSPGPL
jgi:hypothetical protein